MRWNPRRAITATAAAACLLALSSGGCSSAPVARRSESRFHLHGSNTPASVVFSDPALDTPATELANHSEFNRLDSALSPRIASAPQARDQWPQADRPSLRDTRRLFFTNRTGDYLYFDARREHRHRDWRPGW